MTSDSDMVPSNAVPSISVLSPGYLPLDRLLSLRERLLAPPAPWTDHPGGLKTVRRTVEIELFLRGVSTGALATAPDLAGVSWPPLESAEWLAEWRGLAGTTGARIPPPKRVTELWAHHKYAVMARSPADGREIGARLGHQDPTLDEEALLPRLIEYSRTPPSVGRLRDAVMHMWGYVSPVTRTRGLEPDFEDPAGTVRTIAAIALEEPASYLATSTALSDLAVWGAGVPDGP